MNEWFDLGWLEELPRNFPELLKSDSIELSQLKKLVSSRVNDRDARKLAKAIRRHYSSHTLEKEGFSPVNVVFLTDSNLEFSLDSMFIAGLRHGLYINTKLVEYTEVLSEVTNQFSGLYEFAPDFLVYANFGQLLNTLVARFDNDIVRSATEQFKRELEMVVSSASNFSSAQILIQTIPTTFPDLFGNNDYVQQGSINFEIKALNQWIENHELPIIDIRALSSRVGTYNWFDDAKYHWTKTPFNLKWLGVYCEQVARKVSRYSGKEKKCLVLDLDNTLWGGVIGDDGIEGIKLGNNSPVGESYLAGQRYYKMLANRGVVLAVCSKNDMENARLPFESHPDMILTLDDISCFVANWNDKPSNIRAISKALSLGTDSFVFLDDNPAEREIVRRELPEVCVPEVPDKSASLYPRVLEAAAYFETQAFTSTDLGRVADYKANARRAEIKESTSDMDGYLRALDMVLSFKEFESADFDRIVQLINRSNQFNLTTRRYTLSEIQKISRSDTRIGFTVRLRDKFSDNGIIAVIICNQTNQPAWEIDTWLMSCRVLGRKVEQATLDRLSHFALGKYAKSLTGIFIPTSKNGMVADHYSKLGFSCLSSDTSDGNSQETRWTKSLSDQVIKDSVDSLPFKYN